MRGPERLTVLQASHANLCERRRNLHRTIDSLEQASSDAPDVVASLEAYKKNERRISRERQRVYREIGDLITALATAEESSPALDAPSVERTLRDYAELLTRGYCIPDWATGKPELDEREEAWVKALESQAAVDEIVVTHTWFDDRRGGWTLIATIAPPRHNRSYGVPKPLSNPLWRQRFELDWGQRLARARRRVAARELPSDSN